MDVICYGLSLPLTEHDTIKDCVNVYCEWLTALHPQPKLCVPAPVLEDANVYARKIISHLHNLFTPRQGESKLNSRKIKLLFYIILSFLPTNRRIFFKSCRFCITED